MYGGTTYSGIYQIRVIENNDVILDGIMLVDNLYNVVELYNNCDINLKDGQLLVGNPINNRYENGNCDILIKLDKIN